MIFGFRVIAHQSADGEHHILIMILQVTYQFVWRVSKKTLHPIEETLDVAIAKVAYKILNKSRRAVVGVSRIARQQEFEETLLYLTVGKTEERLSVFPV